MFLFYFFPLKIRKSWLFDVKQTEIERWHGQFRCGGKQCAMWQHWIVCKCVCVRRRMVYVSWVLLRIQKKVSAGEKKKDVMEHKSTSTRNQFLWFATFFQPINLNKWNQNHCDSFCRCVCPLHRKNGSHPQWTSEFCKSFIRTKMLFTPPFQAQYTKHYEESPTNSWGAEIICHNFRNSCLIKMVVQIVHKFIWHSALYLNTNTSANMSVEVLMNEKHRRTFIIQSLRHKHLIYTFICMPHIEIAFKTIVWNHWYHSLFGQFKGVHFCESEKLTNHRKKHTNMHICWVEMEQIKICFLSSTQQQTKKEYLLMTFVAIRKMKSIPSYMLYVQYNQSIRALIRNNRNLCIYLCRRKSCITLKTMARTESLSLSRCI